MDEDQHMEWFSVENEFENGMWVGDDFYARKQNSKKRKTKEEVLYGVEDSDSDYEDSQKRRRQNEGKEVDLSKPTSFVSTRTVMPSKELDTKEKEDHASSVSAGLGFGVVQHEEEEVEFLPTTFGRKIKEGAERREIERGKGKKVAKSGGVGPGFAKGIGLKLLEKMGYMGGGLGKNQQGVAKPIEAKPRPKNMGIRFNEFRETTTGLPPVVEKPKSKEKLWTKKNKGKKTDELRFAVELIAEKEAKNRGSIQQTVLDMRGPQPRLFTNLENLNVAIEDNTLMPELQYNLRLIVDMTKAEIQTCNQRLQNERDTMLILNKERERLETAVSAQGKLIAVMETVMSSLEQIRRQVAEGVMNLANLANAFAKIMYSYQEEYKIFNVGIIALRFSLPLMSNFFRGWQPFLQPQHGIEAMVAWKDLLQGKEENDVDNSPYLQLVHEVVFPHVCLAITNVWQPRDPEPILRFLEAWNKVLPRDVIQNLLEGVVMPKLTAAVDAWDPRLEEVPIHAWLHPWLPWLDTRMEPLYVPIRYKLRLHNRPQPARVQPQQQHATLNMEENGSGEELSLKEVVEVFARDNDIKFIPKPGRTYEGLQVYSLGAINVVIDTAKQSILAQTGDGWNAVYLEQILKMHRSRGG